LKFKRQVRPIQVALSSTGFVVWLFDGLIRLILSLVPPKAFVMSTPAILRSSTIAVVPVLHQTIFKARAFLRLRSPITQSIVQPNAIADNPSCLFPSSCHAVPLMQMNFSIGHYSKL
jgi:hypothetical protein